jgi:hypothetical protein
MEKPDETFVVCVGEKDEHIEESILTNCCDCNCRVWVSITNADKKPLCWSCVAKRAKVPGDNVQIYTTPETMAEALRELAKLEKKRRL